MHTRGQDRKNLYRMVKISQVSSLILPSTKAHIFYCSISNTYIYWSGDLQKIVNIFQKSFIQLPEKQLP